MPAPVFLALRPLRRFGSLLPPGRKLGWLPYAWLVYLPTFFVAPVQRGASVVEWAAIALATLAFLASYFVGYHGGNRRLRVAVLVPLALGVGFTAGNPGATVFFIYAAAFAGQFVPPRVGLQAVAGVTGIALGVTWLSDPPLYFWIATVVFVPFVGAINYHFAQVERADAKLRLAQSEVEHLAAVAERERIARDLHDVLGHTLSLVVVKAQLAARLADHDAARAAREMRDVETVARAALGEVRETIRGYRASVAGELAQAQQLLHAAGVRLVVEREPGALDGLERRCEEALAMALREGVTNVARHAAAHSCTVHVRRRAASCVLEVEDDGRGNGAGDGAGLRGMRERVERLGGTMQRERGAAGGTRLVVAIPLTAHGALAEPLLAAVVEQAAT